MDKSIEFIKKNVKSNSTIISATSGGPDSMVLLSLLIDLKEELNLNIVCAHINHKLREESDEECAFVKTFAEKNNIIFESISFDKYNTNNIESEAHNRRYDYFKLLSDKYDAKYVLTAHHGDDLIETILMKIARGSSLDGYVGFSKKREQDSYILLRPLIFYNKEDILIYAKENGIDYRIDKSNFDKKYTRNRYRLNILPLLKEENKNIHLKYLNFSEELEKSSKFINNYLLKKYQGIYINNKIDIQMLLKEDEFIIEKIIYKYLLDIYKNNINLIEKKHIDNILKFIKSKKHGYITIPDDKKLYFNYKYLYLVNNIIEDDYKFLIENEVSVPGGRISIIDKTNLTNNLVTHLDSKKLKLPLYVRNKKDGDYIEVLNLCGKKKIKDIFIENKVDIEKRKSYPVVVDSNDVVVYLPGLKKSKYDTLKSGKYDIIIWYNEEES